MSKKKISAEVMDRSIEPDRVVLALNTIEESPSYRILATHKLLTNKYRVLHASDLHLRPPNSTLCTNCIIRIGCCPLACCCCIRVFEVPNGQMKLGYDGRGNYVFFGPGVHRLMDPFYSLNFKNKCELVPLRVPILYCSKNLSSFLTRIIGYTENIVHGDRTIVTVEQGFIGYCTDRGDPVILPPGMHQ